MTSPSEPVVFFAVKEETEFFPSSPRVGARVLVTGMGRVNTEKTFHRVVEGSLPSLVLTCGFAGGLRPGLVSGTVLAEAEDPSLRAKLTTAGARSARFHCAPSVAVTISEKQALFKKTGADAVEMESEVIRQLCRERQIPSATVRVILDAAEEDLPLDFNSLMTPDLRIDPARLALALVRSPAKIPALIRFRSQSRAAARALASVLQRFFEPRASGSAG
jgi:hypothetical protein